MQHGLILNQGLGAVYLDDLAISPTAAWGLKKLISTATLSLRIRRSSDNAEQDIGFTGNALDTTALASFVGANSGFVVTFYDQTGNTRHATNATSAQQPMLVNAGSYLGELVFDGTNDRLTAPAITMGTPYLGFYAKMKQANAETNRCYFDNSNSGTASQSALLYVSTPNRWYMQSRNAAADLGQLRFTVSNITTAMIVNATWDRTLALTSEMKLWRNGASETVDANIGVDQTGNFGNNVVTLGAATDGTLPSNGAYESCALYNADTAAIRTAISALL